MKRLLVASVAVATFAALPSPAGAAVPELKVKTVVSGLSIPWDLSFLPDGGMLFTERSALRLSLRTPGGAVRTIFEDRGHMWSSGETGLMAVEVAHDFASTRGFFTCHGFRNDGAPHVRVVRWRLNAAQTSATKVKTLLRGLPATSGRHGGCALEKGGHNTLYVGTGDAATGTNPQRLKSGGGKVMRIDATTGKPWKNNPWAKNSNYIKSRVWTYGHRNVQGLARRNDGRMWSNEHGSNRDDEVNRLKKGGNFGWDPVPREAGDPSYNEGSNSPMTDYSIPAKQIGAKWSSGTPTIASSGITFVYGSAWGSYQGSLAVAALKDSSLRFMKFEPNGHLIKVRMPDELDGTYGRLRAAVQGPDGALYITTSNGTNDKILRVTPVS